METLVPPHSDDAERSLLGAILLEGEVLGRVLPLVAAEDFYSTSHQRIYEACAHLRREGARVDPVLIKAELERRGDLEKVGGEAYLAQLAAQVPSAAGAEDYARIVRGRAAQRQAIALAVEMQEAAYHPGRLDELAAQQARLKKILASATRGRDALVFRTPDALQENSTGVAWRCRGLLADGYVTLFVGKPKDGKSTMAFALLAAIEAGVPFLGLETAKAIAVYVCEENARTIRQKAERFGLRQARFVTRAAAYPRRPFAEVVRAAIEEAERMGARILVIDTLTMWACLPPDAEKDAGAVQVAIDVALEAAGAGLAVLVIHHMRKATGDDVDTVRGSGAIVAGADILATLSRTSGEDRTLRALRVVGRDEECPPELVIRLGPRAYERVGTADEVKERDLREAVHAVLPEAPEDGLTETEVRTAVGGRNEAVLRALGELRKAERAEVAGEGKKGDPRRWRRPADGFRSHSGPHTGGTGMESREGGRSAPESVAEDPEGDSVPIPPIGREQGTESGLALSLPPVPWLGHASELAAIWDDLWSRWQERAATLEIDGGLPREEAERRPWQELAAPRDAEEPPPGTPRGKEGADAK